MKDSTNGAPSGIRCSLAACGSKAIVGERDRPDEYVSGDAQLGAGRHTLTASIAASRMKRWRNPAPWTIGNLEIRLPEPPSYGTIVAVPPGLTIKTPAYKPDQWTTSR